MVARSGVLSRKSGMLACNIFDVEIHTGKALIHMLFERALNACKDPIDLKIQDPYR